MADTTNSRALRAAGLASAATVAFDMAGRATRDAVFLAQFGARALPPMVIGGSAVALVVGLAVSRLLTVAAPTPWLRRALIVSGCALLAEWGLSRVAMHFVAVTLYLHVTALSGLFVSGLWTCLSERFDPRTMRHSVGRIAAAGTAGGVAAGVIAALVAAAGSIGPMLAVMAILNFMVAASLGPLETTARPVVHTEERSSVRAAFASPYVRALIALVVLGAVAETLLDFVFMTQANAIFHDAAALLRVFAALYTVAAILTVVVQLAVVRRLIDVLGLPPVAAFLPAGVLTAAVGAIAWPGLMSAAIARGTELVLRNSTFRSAYELLFNALPTREKRAAKTLVDVTALRAGRILGSGAIQAALIVSASRAVPFLLGAAAGVSGVTLALFPWIARGHRRALGDHLESRVELDDSVGLSEMLVTGTFAIQTEEETPLLVDTLRNPETSVLERSRLVRLLGSRPTAEARDALLEGLADERFEMRYRSGLALARLVAADPALAPPAATILTIITREIAVDRRIWESRGLIALLPDERPTELLGEALEERTDRSLEHVFRLLALVLPDEPLRAAFRALRSEDAHLRGAALDYVESVVPIDIRRKLWRAIASGPTMPHVRTSALDEVSLLYDEYKSIELRVSELHRQRIEKKTDGSG